MKIKKVIMFILLTVSFIQYTISKNIILTFDDIKTSANGGDFISEKFKNYNIIALDEGPHSTLQTHMFLRSLFKSDKFIHTVQYIILEMANENHQAILDDYINGKPVSKNDLLIVWRDHTQAHSDNLEKPVYLKLLQTIRDVNLKLAPNKKIRVLAGDPPVDWKKINSINEYFRAISQRDVLPSHLAIKYGIDSSKKVLLIYGGEHISKLSNEKNDSTFWTIPFFINKKYPNSVYTIGAYVSEDYKSQKIHWAVNSIHELATDSIGSLTVKDASKEKQVYTLRDVFDAVYYAGPSDKWKKDTPVTIDSFYWEELNRRAKIIWGEGIDTKLKASH